MKFIIADTIKEGNACKHHFTLYPKQIKVLSTPNSIRGRKFGPNDMVYLLTEDQEIWKSLQPALQGAPVFCYRLK